MPIVKFTTATAGAEVHTRAERHAAEQKCEYREAVRVVLASDKQLAEAYAEPASRVTATKPAVPVSAPVPLAQGKDAGETVHLRVTALMDLVPSLNYQSAVTQVLAADPGLRTAYARS